MSERGLFPSTIWTMIENLDSQGDVSGADAMNRFITAYWKPIFYFLRRHEATRTIEPRI